MKNSLMAIAFLTSIILMIIFYGCLRRASDTNNMEQDMQVQRNPKTIDKIVDVVVIEKVNNNIIKNKDDRSTNSTKR